jgi:hypothetical protein
MTTASLAVGAAIVGTLYVTVVPELGLKLPKLEVHPVPVTVLLRVSVVVELQTED